MLLSPGCSSWAVSFGIAAMPSRSEKSVMATTWRYSARTERAHTTAANRNLFLRGMVLLQTACRTSGPRTVEARDSQSITIKNPTPHKYDSARAWLARVTGEDGAKLWVVSPVVARHDPEVSTLTGPVDAENADAEATEPRPESNSEPSPVVSPPVLAVPAEVAGLDPAALTFKCLRLVEKHDPGRSQDYKISGEEKCLGEGTYGKVFPGVHKASGRQVALKFFKDNKSSDARRSILEEVLLLREAKSDHCIPLLDICRLGDSFVAVFPWRTCLRKMLVSGKGLEKVEIAVVCRQLFAGLAHLHAARIFHADIKPDNILARVPAGFRFSCRRTLAAPAGSSGGDSGGNRLWERARQLKQLDNEVLIQICDFGLAMCLDAAPSKQPEEIQTLWYRAPELLVGDKKVRACVGLAADIWSAGCVLAELGAGKPAFRAAPQTPTEQLRIILHNKGTGAVPLKWTASTRYPENWCIAGEGWPAELRNRLGDDGMECLQGCTELDPTRRLTAQMAAETLFLDGKAMRCFPTPSGCSSWIAKRGEFCLQFGELEPDVRAYICGDPWWTEKAPALLDFRKRTKSAPDVDKDNKVEIVYTAEEPVPGTDATLNGAPIQGRCPIVCLNAWLRAFKKVNIAILELMDEEMVALLARMSLDDLGMNGRHFITSQAAAEWFCKYLSLQMLTTVERQDTAHFDGGASILHMGLTLWGRRRLYLNLADPAEKVVPMAGPAGDEWVVTHQRPGSVYLANLCAPFHQVGHEGEDDPDDLFHAPSGQSYKVAIMFRTSCFGYARARTSSTPPNPKQVFEIVSSVIHKVLLSNRFCLPSLQDCLEQEEQLRS